MDAEHRALLQEQRALEMKELRGAEMVSKEGWGGGRGAGGWRAGDAHVCVCVCTCVLHGEVRVHEDMAVCVSAHSGGLWEGAQGAVGGKGGTEGQIGTSRGGHVGDVDP